MSDWVKTGLFYLYLITNLVNGKIYVGQTNYPNQRWSQHRSDAKRKKYPTLIVDRAIKKYGHENFTYEMIATAKTRADCNALEDILIIQHDTRNKEIGYNINAGGESRNQSEETKQKISNALLKYYTTHDGTFKGKKLSEEHKAAVSKGSMGKPGTNTGKKFSDDHKKKISESNTGNPRLTERKFTEVQEKEICDLYTSGMTTNQLGKKFDCYTSVITSVLDRGKVARRIHLGAQNAANARRKFTDEQELEMCRLYTIENKTQAAIAKIFNCKNNVIGAILFRRGARE